MIGWNPGAPRLVANIFRARSLAQCDRNSVVLLHLDGWRKKSVPFVTILESVSLQKYWSTDWNKVFDLHGLQASEGFNSTNSETVKCFPSLSCYWVYFRLRCLFVKLLFLQNISKLGCFSILWASEMIVTSFVHSRANMAGRLQTVCWNCGLSEMEGKTCTDLKGQRWCLLVFEGWRVGLCFQVVFICSTDQQRFFTAEGCV